MSVWEQRSRDAAPTRTVTGAILALHETQRLVVGGKTGHHVLRRESEMGFCVPIDPGGEMVTRFVFTCTSGSGYGVAVPYAVVPWVQDDIINAEHLTHHS
jgi:hypothetical protein